MARKKLSVKSEEKTNPLRKKLQVKEKDNNFSNEFPFDLTMYASNTLITNDESYILIVPDAHEFLKKQKVLSEKIEFFEWEDVGLQLEFNRQEQLELNNDGTIGSMGKIFLCRWLTLTYPNCVFHQITKWFGKVVNTLVIVLAEEHGKPVAIIKTQE